MKRKPTIVCCALLALTFLLLFGILSLPNYGNFNGRDYGLFLISTVLPVYYAILGLVIGLCLSLKGVIFCGIGLYGVTYLACVTDQLRTIGTVEYDRLAYICLWYPAIAIGVALLMQIGKRLAVSLAASYRQYREKRSSR